ncbi:1-phosphofructokinase [Actinoalloteichus hoggarensis]|uniref:6-phosphofructokinase isozyme 2 n=1 Tax=Actinoalloteichus hoggarensis TaxID=1470176 RepID=A0A221W7D4_9PSEU|nr:PfkB family carbohydrate kinase [Actinoalloteichus hoggarensis]ASO21890.1 6-phosphofructokinase isozyme 2 [Actinoalloteichus hoggarensis]MBB5922487.1 1-phosphofructokinase [Actinoalloteichus hoggarensis]
MTEHVMVFAPSPQLTVTVEDRGEEPDLHLHAGGQGVWQARMIAALGVPVVLCAALGGETGAVLRHLIVDDGLELKAVDVSTRNGGYVHDRRGGVRREIVDAPGEPLSRHELDDLYELSLVHGLDARLSVLSGPSRLGTIPADTYRRLAADMTGNGGLVLVDLAGEQLDAALAGGVSMVKISHEELIADGRSRDDDRDSLIKAAKELRAAGPGAVLVSRAAEPALALLDDVVYEVRLPVLQPAEPRGAGDSMAAGVAAALVRGRSLTEAVRLGAAAGAVNVVRRGLGTGSDESIEVLAAKVELREI